MDQNNMQPDPDAQLFNKLGSFIAANHNAIVEKFQQYDEELQRTKTAANLAAIVNSVVGIGFLGYVVYNHVTSLESGESYGG